LYCGITAAPINKQEFPPLYARRRNAIAGTVKETAEAFTATKNRYNVFINPERDNKNKKNEV
jgi:hypothetical protein